MKNKKIIFISDFDGTITKQDFFHMAAERILHRDSLQPWEEYHAGRLTHIEALNRIFADIRLSQKEMNAFIATIRVDRAFFAVAALCRKLKIPMQICSAGTEYYVKKRIGRTLKKYNIGILSNGGKYSPKTGLLMIPPPPSSPFYDEDAGISKAAFVQSFKDKGFFVIFAGDGRPDIKAARIADKVFARDLLLELCRKEGLVAQPLKTFKDISAYIKELKNV